MLTWFQTEAAAPQQDNIIIFVSDKIEVETKLAIKFLIQADLPDFDGWFVPD